MFQQITLISLIMALAEVLKRAGIDKKYIPVFNIVLGGFIGLATIGINADGIITGLMMGASACGVFDFAKKTFTSSSEDSNQIDE